MTWKDPSTLEKIPGENGQQRELDYSSSDFSFFHRLLFQHVVQQKNEGVPVLEIENFLQDRNAVKSFFESRGCRFSARGDRNNGGYHFSIIERPIIRGEDGVDVLDGYQEELIEDNLELRSSGELEDSIPLSRFQSDENPNSWVGLVKGGISWLKYRSKLNFWKLVKIMKYLTICGIVMIIGHFGMCHLLDVNPLQFFPSLMEKRCLLPAHPIIMEMTRPIADCRFCREDSDDKWGNVIEMHQIPNKTVFAEVAYLSKPVIIRGGGLSGGMPEGFDFKKLKEIFQSEPGGVDAVSEECQFLPFRSPFGTLREAFDRIGENLDWDEPWYIGWSNCHPGVAAKLRKLFPRPNFLPDDSSSSAIDWIFIGSPGLGASMHVDYVKSQSWQAQLSGTKRWLLHPPPECESVCPESISLTIYPGDLLFLETNTWYHQTFIEGDTFSISIGSEYD